MVSVWPGLSTMEASMLIAGAAARPLHLLPVAQSRGRRSSVCAQANIRVSKRSPRPQNTPGEFFVDHTCIDCDTCRWMAPNVFSRADGMSAVHHQPTSGEERLSALQALLSCPTASIHTVKPPTDIEQVHETFPLPVDELSAEGVYHCGYHSAKSFGATTYFIAAPTGNILVDSPKFTEKLAKRFESMGGVRYMFLTHKDDVADHKLWHQRFKCQRILHASEVQESTADVEIKLEGSGPWDILGPDFQIILTPGHTEGSICLHYKPKKVLVTGDHLFADDKRQLQISHTFLFYSVEEQIKSLKRLLPLDFVWVLPGHGRRVKFETAEAKNAALAKFIEEESKMSAVS